MHNVMLFRFRRFGVSRHIKNCYDRRAYSTHKTRHFQTVQIPIGGNGTVDVEIAHRESPHGSEHPSVLLCLPPGPLVTEATQPVDQPSKSALEQLPHAAIVTIRYRLSSPLPYTDTHQLGHRYPLPIHDVCVSFDYLRSTILPELFPAIRSEKQPSPQIDIASSHIGGALATTLALVEPNSIHAVNIADPIADWCMFDEYAGLAKDQPAASSKSKKTQQPTGNAEAIRQAAQAYIAARTRLFPSPSSYFDPFASPMLFVRAPGRDTPRTHAEALGLVGDGLSEASSTSRDDAGSSEEDEDSSAAIAYGPYDDDVHTADHHLSSTLSDTESISVNQKQQTTKRRKVLRRWPPIGRPEDVLLPRFNIYTTSPKDPADGQAWLLHKQATDLASYLPRACFFGRERGFAEERVRLYEDSAWKESWARSGRFGAAN